MTNETKALIDEIAERIAAKFRHYDLHCATITVAAELEPLADVLDAAQFVPAIPGMIKPIGVIMSDELNLEQSVGILNREGWRQRHDWRVICELSVWSSHKTPDFYDPINYASQDAMAIAKSLVAEKRIEELETIKATYTQRREEMRGRIDRLESWLAQVIEEREALRSHQQAIEAVEKRIEKLKGMKLKEFGDSQSGLLLKRITELERKNTAYAEYIDSISDHKR